MVKLRLATWNVWTLNDEVRRDKVFEELKKHDIDIVCLQETKIFGRQYSGVDHIIRCPQQDEENCHHGVGFAYKKIHEESYKLKKCDPKRLIVIKFDLNNEIIHIINAYAPTNVSKSEDKENFYDCLEKAFSEIDDSETVFIIGDLNAQVGADNVAWPTCLGPYGVRKMNDNGQRLLEFCSLHDLCVLNTYTELKENEPLTHRHPDSRKKWSQLDLCITRVKDRHKVIYTKPVNLVGERFDHTMVIVEINTSLLEQRFEDEFSEKKRDAKNILKCTRKEKDIEKKIENFLDGKLQNPLNRENFQTLTIQWCKYCALPEELLYIYINKQCMNSVNPTTTFQSTDFCSTLHLLAECMLTKLKKIVTGDILESHYIFKCKSKKDMLFALNLLQEKFQKKEKKKKPPLYIAFVEDLVQILNNGKKTTPVKSLTDIDQQQRKLMKYFLSYILDQSFNGFETTLKLTYNFQGKLFRQRRFNKKEYTHDFPLRAIQYGQSAAIFATTRDEIQKCLEKLESTCNSLGLSFLQNNPLVLEQNVQTAEQGQDLLIESEQVKISKSVNFLGINFTSVNFSLETDIFLRIHNACKSLKALLDKVQKSRKSPEIKDQDIDCFCHELISNLEVLSLTDQQERALEKFYAKSLSRLKVPPKSVSILMSFRLARLSLLGDYYRDKNNSVTKRLLYGDRVDRRLSACYIKKLEKDMKSLQIDINEWETLANNKEI